MRQAATGASPRGPRSSGSPPGGSSHPARDRTAHVPDRRSPPASPCRCQGPPRARSPSRARRPRTRSSPISQPGDRPARPHPRPPRPSGQVRGRGRVWAQRLLVLGQAPLVRCLLPAEHAGVGCRPQALGSRVQTHGSAMPGAWRHPRSACLRSPGPPRPGAQAAIRNLQRGGCRSVEALNHPN